MNDSKIGAAKGSGKGKRRNDLILILVLLILSGTLFLVRTLSRPSGKMVVVHVDGETQGTYPLETDVRVEIPSGEQGDHLNVLVIRDGKASMEQADCPDLICVQHAPISLEDDTIVCLPNKVVVSIE
ncbi:MAG: NusG domain II-containing protein [Lachnospiraceae bacterium]|nr:NusG domain II-containing protein [Lachnospiraceae bacterium]